MNKRTRFVILLAVLAVCFAFLWPSISWYYGTPKEMKAHSVRCRALKIMRP